MIVSYASYLSKSIIGINIINNNKWHSTKNDKNKQTCNKTWI